MSGQDRCHNVNLTKSTMRVCVLSLLRVDRSELRLKGKKKFIVFGVTEKDIKSKVDDSQIFYECSRLIYRSDSCMEWATYTRRPEIYVVVIIKKNVSTLAFHPMHIHPHKKRST